jgi:hypothetical protein
MIYGIDLHGVADSYPGILRPLMEGFLGCGNEVIVISGPPEVEVEAALRKLGYRRYVNYSKIVSVVDYLKSKGVEMWQDKRKRWWCEDESWWSSKAEICAEHKVDVLLDDSPQYEPYFKDSHTRFILVTPS